MVGEVPRDTSEISLDTSGGRLEVISSLLKKVDVIMLLRDSVCCKKNTEKDNIISPASYPVGSFSFN